MPQAEAARLSVPNSQGYARRAWCKTRCAHGGLIDPSTITRSCWCRRLAPCVHYSSSFSSRSLSVRLSRPDGWHGQNRSKTNYAAQLSSAALEVLLEHAATLFTVMFLYAKPKDAQSSVIPLIWAALTRKPAHGPNSPPLLWDCEP